MKTVCVLTEGVFNEGGRVLGVFASSDIGMPAFLAAAENIGASVEPHTVKADGSAHVKYFQFWVALDVYEVKEEIK